MDRKEIAAEWDQASDTSRENMLRGVGELDLIDQLDYLNRPFEKLPLSIKVRIAIKLGEFE
jgi:hypothetical protein